MTFLVLVLAVVLGGPVGILVPILLVVFVTFAIGVFVVQMLIITMNRSVKELTNFSGVNVFERGPKLFGMVAVDLFALKRWRPGP
ncbi:hypothetical protein ACN27J_30990 [Solwaraspora sp. WMMB762]|uniref:hypothetical protein n=1 Tax=Solwaraspora sp. WMMB762 TaxID=3404120 RepID=UPI003B95371B